MSNVSIKLIAPSIFRRRTGQLNVKIGWVILRTKSNWDQSQIKIIKIHFKPLKMESSLYSFTQFSFVSIQKKMEH